MKTTYYNNPIAKLILFSGYTTIMLFGFILTKLNYLKPSTVRHEQTHRKQYFECLTLALPIAILAGGGWWLLIIPVFYYILYLWEYLVRFACMAFRNKGESISKLSNNTYRSISFEKEAYQNQDDIGYLDNRKWFSWIMYY